MSYDVLAMIVNKLFKLGEGLCVDLHMVNVLQWSFPSLGVRRRPSNISF